MKEQGGIGIIKFKKVTKAIVLLPSLIFVATFIYGMMKFDISGNTPNQSYGLIYSLVVQSFVFLAYLLAFILNTVVAVFFLKQINRKKSQLQLLISIYVTSLLLIIVLFFTMGYSAFFPYKTLFVPGTMGVGLMALSLAVTGWLVVDQSKEEIKDQSKTIRLKSIIFGMLVPIFIVILTVGTRLAFITYEQTNRNDEYKQVIEQKLHSVGTKGDVKIIKAYHSSKESTHVQLNYTLTQEGTTVYAKGVLQRSKANEKWKLIDSSLTTYDKSIQTILQVPTHSEEAEAFLDLFTQEVEKSITKSELTKEIGVNTPLEKNEIRTRYDSPYLSFNNELVPTKVKEWAKENSHASNKKKEAFGGYSALTVKQLMKSHTIIANVPIQYPYVDDSDFDEREENAEKYRDIVIKNLDYSKLMDGYYEISVGKANNSRTFLVKKHQMVEVDEFISSSLLEQPTDGLGSFSSSDYMEW